MLDTNTLFCLLFIVLFVIMYKKHRVELFENVETSLTPLAESLKQLPTTIGGVLYDPSATVPTPVFKPADFSGPYSTVAEGTQTPGLATGQPAAAITIPVTGRFTKVTSFTPNIPATRMVATDEKGRGLEYYTRFKDLDHPGNDLTCNVYGDSTNITKCSTDCAQDPNCLGFVDVTKGTNSVIPQGFCCTKTWFGDAIGTQGVTSYIK